MLSTSDTRSTARLRGFAAWTGPVVAGIGCLVLVGWALGIEALTRILPGLTTMKANTALAFVCSGSALQLLRREQSSPHPRIAGLLLASIVCLIAGLSLYQYLMGSDLGIDHLLFVEKTAALGLPGRMAPATALNFLLLGLALLLLDHLRHAWIQAVAIVPLAISVLTLSGYVRGEPTLYQPGATTPVALHTAVTFIILACGVLAARPGSGWMAIITSDSAGGTAARRLLPAAICVPILFGWLALSGEHLGLYGRRLDIAVFALSCMVLITFAILWVAMVLHRADQNRTAAEAGLNELVQLAAFGAAVSVTVARPEALHQRFQQCSDSMVRDLDAALAGIWTLDESANMLDLVAGSGLDTHPGGLNRRLPVGQLAIGRIARDRAPHLTDDVQNDPLVGDQEWARREGMVAFAGHPLLVGDRLVGVMAIFSRQPLTAATLETIKTVANSIALGIARDRSEVALRQTHARLGAVMRDSPLAIICLDQASQVTVWNPAAERILGWTESEVLGRRMPIDVSPAPDAPLPGRDRGIAPSGSTPLETRCRRRDGTELDVQIVATTLQASGGEQAGTLLFLADISEKIRADAQYRQSLKMDALGRLAGGVAHDFNNLLTAIMGYGELVKNSLAPDAPARRDADEILNAAERGAALTRQLLAFSRNQPLEYTTLCLNESIDGIGTMLRHFIGEAITLVTAPGALCPHIRADAGEVEQVLLNLVINARDAMPEGGTITIETADVVFDHDPAAVRSSGPSGPHVMLAVSDTGVGISREVQARLFDPFFTTKDFGKGTGLGLSTVHGVITRCGGFVEVVSQLGIGTTFKLFFPRTTEPLSAVSHPESTGGSHTAGETVLLVEDEQPLRRVIHQSLRRSGFTVLEAADPEAAIAICERPEQVIDLLLTDVVMPVMTGPELARRVASLRPELPVLFISGYAEFALAQKQGAGRGASFLQKPFTPEELADTIRGILELPLQRTA